MLALLTLLTTAYAGGFYHPADIASESAVFAKASEQVGVKFEESARSAEQLAAGLRDYELSLDLLGERAPAAERARLDGLKQEFNREFAVLDAFAATMGEDFETVFGEALERALAAHPGAQECVRELQDGPALPGIAARSKPNPDCKGDDLNARVAKAIDADPKLVAAVDEILALQWPEVAVDTAPQAPIGGGDRYVDVAHLFRKGARDALKTIDRADEQARLPFQTAIEQGASKEELQKLLADAEQVTAATAAKRAALAAPVIGTANAAAAKWAKKGEPATGWCANPAVLGGCTGTDATVELVERLIADKKVAAALP